MVERSNSSLRAVSLAMLDRAVMNDTTAIAGSAQNDSDTRQDYDYPLKDFDIWKHYLRPSHAEWFVISLYVIVFVISIVGNSLVVAYILRRKHLHTTVNYFMLNLALADVLVTIICLPPTMMVDFLESWLMGRFLCKLVPFLQMTVTLVSSLTLGAIAVNRWFVVCHPLRCSTFHKSSKSAGMVMAAIWLFSLSTLCPVAFFNELTPDFEGYEELSLLMSCGEHWPTLTYQAAFHTYYVTVGYALPLFILGVTYTKVFKALSRKEIPGFSLAGRSNCKCSDVEARRTNDNLASSRLPLNSASSIISSVTSNLYERPPSFTKEARPLVQTRRTSSMTRRIRRRISLAKSDKIVCRKCSAKIMLIHARKKSARMQVALIVVFGLCYAPVMILDLVRRAFGGFGSVNRGTIYFVFAVAHLLMYLNSALNPIIYNFFSAQFRREFRSTFRCFQTSNDNRQHTTHHATTGNYTRSVSLQSISSPSRRSTRR
uniref:Orexin receptor type 1 n=1 Tax=Phallusia mammillata TaxID=59560 RepID=A0A6F9DEJ6_9ASCI|nr:orexin receptor type 1 [Phallusia mammillata]